MNKAVALLLLFVSFATSSLAQTRPTTKEERQRLLEVVVMVEEDPTNPVVAKRQEWAFLLLALASDIKVNIPGLAMELKDRMPAKNQYRSLLCNHFIIACGADMVRNGGREDPLRMTSYALKSCLTVYASLTKDHPERKIDVFAELQKKDEKELAEYVKESLKKHRVR